VRHIWLYSCLFACLWFFSLTEAAFAEQRLIAVIMANSQPRYQDIHSTFISESKTFCGSDCKLYVQTPNADMMSLRNAVRKAVALGAELIVTYGPLSTLAAQAEIPPIPILFADVYDPVGLGIVSAKTLTGRNTTGIRGDAPIQGLLKYFSDTVDLHKLGIIYDIHSPEALLQKSVLEESARRRGIETAAVGVGDSSDHLVPLNQLPHDIEGVFVASSEHHESQLRLVIDHTSARNVPVITQRAKAAELGAFMVLESSAVEQGEKLAEMAGKVLAGAEIESIPMHRPHKVSFVINLKAAKQYGIDVPIQTLSVASRVIR
jgi:putative ABC transport system substrate-binding protein